MLATEMTSGVHAVFSLDSRRQKEGMLDTYSAQKVAALFALFKKNGTWQCPTLTLLRSSTLGFYDEPSFAHDLLRMKCMPQGLRARWQGRRGALAKSPNFYFTLTKPGFQRYLELVGAMQKAGVGILAGTDTLNPYCSPGFSLHDELSLLVRAGLTPMQALQAATLNAARFLGTRKDFGTIAEGKVADLDLFDANPLEDINNTNKIASVIYRGKFYSREALDEVLARVETVASKKSIALALMKTINEKDVDSAIREYHQLKAMQPEAYDFGENELIVLGNQLLGQKKVKAAIRFLLLNAEAYPHSPEVYENLGEAYLQDGDKKLAVNNCRKALQLNPEDFIAARVLEKFSTN